MSFEIASTTTCGQSLLARATATNQLVFVNAKIETTARTANEIGNATALPTLTNPVTGAINSVTYTLNQTRVTVRFNNLVTTANFHTVWLMAKLANEDDSAAVPISAVVSSEAIYIPTTSQSDTHIDIHLNLSFVRADGQVSITEGPAWMISDQIQYRNEVRAELDDIEADIDDLQSTVVTIAGAQTIYGAKSFNATTAFNGAVQANSTLNVTGTTTLGTLSAGSTTTGTLTTYAITPRTASTSSSTGYDLGGLSNQWRYVFARYGEFETSLNTDGSLSVSGISNLSGDVNIGGELSVGGETTLEDVIAGDITSTNHIPTANSTSTSTGSNLGASDARWRYVYGRYGDFSGSISTAGTLSVTGASTLTGNTSVGGTLGVTGASTLAGVTAGAVSSYSHTPRTASTSSTTGYDLGSSDNRWKYVYARYGNFSYSLNVSGTVTATTFSGNLSGHLTTAQNIDGMAFDGSAAITHFGTCDTAAATAAKTVALSGFSLETGARILVKFTNSNTASSPTLNVNSTGAVRIYLRVNTTAGTTNVTSWEAGDTVEFVYDGSYWRKVNHTTNISGNAATATSATSATSATYATYLRYSTTTVMSAAGTTTITSAATIRPTADGGSSLGSSSYKWNYLYCNCIGSSSYYVTSAYITNMYGTASKATADASGNTITSTYLKDVTIVTPAGVDKTSAGSSGISNVTASNWPTFLRLTKGNGTGTTDICLSNLVASYLIGFARSTTAGNLSPNGAEGSIALLQVQRSSSSTVISRGSLLSNYTATLARGLSANGSTNSIEWTSGNTSVTGTWVALSYTGTSNSSYNYCLVLAIRIY